MLVIVYGTTLLYTNTHNQHRDMHMQNQHKGTSCIFMVFMLFMFFTITS